MVGRYDEPGPSPAEQWRETMKQTQQLIATLDAERAAHKATEGHAQILLRDIDTLAARVQQLEEALRTAMQRCNESGIGEAGLVATIHAVHGILRAALAKKESDRG